MAKKWPAFLLPFIVIMLVSISMVSWLSYKSTQAALHESVTKQFRLILGEVEHDISANMEQLMSLAVIVSEVPSVEQLVTIRMLSARERVTMLLQSITRNTTVDDMAVLSAQGEVLGSGHSLEWQQADARKFLPTILMGHTMQGVLSNSMSGSPVLFVALPVNYSDKAEGMVFATLDTQTLFRILQQRLILDLDMRLSILSDDSTIVASTDPDMEISEQYATSPFKRSLLLSEQTLLSTREDGSRRGMHVRLADLGLYLVVSADTSALFAPSSASFWRTLRYNTIGWLVGLIFFLISLRAIGNRLDRSEYQLDRIVDTARLATWTWEATYGGMLRVNRHFCALLGLPERRTTFDTRWYLDHVHPADPVGLPPQEGAQAEQAPCNQRIRLRHTDGHWHWLECHGHITEQDADGYPRRAVGVYLDIHDHVVRELQAREYQHKLEKDVADRTLEIRENEAALRREQALLYAVIDNLPDLIYYMDTKHHLIGANRAFLNFFGASQDRGHRHLDEPLFSKLFSPDVLRKLREQDAYVLQTGETLHTEEELPTLDGTLIRLDTTRVRYTDSDGYVLGTMGICRNISQLPARAFHT